MANWVVAYFSSAGSPKTGLSPSVTIRDLLNDTVVVSAGAMVEHGGGFYKYNFTLYNSSKDYTCMCDGGSTLSAPERYSPAMAGPGDLVRDYYSMRSLGDKTIKR